MSKDINRIIRDMRKLCENRAQKCEGCPLKTKDGSCLILIINDEEVEELNYESINIQH